MKNILLIVLALSFFQACRAQKKNIDWNSDLDFLSKELARKHYDLFASKSRNYYLKEIQKIKATTEHSSSFDIAIRIQQLIASMGDSHTKIKLNQFIDKNKLIPVHIAAFSDGYYILHTSPENKEILGHKINSINKTPIKTVINSLSSLVTLDNEAITKIYIPKLLPLVQLLEYFQIVNDENIVLGLENVNGTQKEYNIKTAQLSRKNRVSFKPDSLALCYRNERAHFIDYYLAQDQTYYIQYNRCWSKELELKYNEGRNARRIPSFEKFEDRIFKNLKANKVNKFVFDLRFNPGGSSLQGTELIEKYADLADHNPELETYVILGSNTFSSALLNAFDFKRLTDATFVGEATAGKPNHYGEVKSFKLPNSGLVVNYSTKYFRRSQENEDSLYPDIAVTTSFKDFKEGIDPVYEWIKKQ